MANGTHRFGRYELHSVMGEGGAGRVYAATLHGPGGLRRPVALKVLHDRAASLQREARIGGLLRHRHLVDVYEVGEEDGQWFAAMELCSGGALSAYLPLPPKAVVEVGLQVAAALQYAHEELGLVHLDIKPANLLLKDGVVKVADLGIAQARGFSSDAHVRGTPGYIAPEQLRGLPVDARTDLYALGVTLVVLATGAMPRSGDTTDWGALLSGASKTAPETWSFATLVAETGSDVPTVREPAAGQLDLIPEWLLPAIQGCLPPDPDERWADMTTLAAALRALDVEGEGLREAIRWSPPPAVRQHATNLGREPDPFVGREDELETLGAALERPGLVTLKGPAGIGKSRLADAAARRWRARTGGQAWRCELSEARTLEGLLFTVASALDVPISRGDADTLVTQLGNAIAGRAREESSGVVLILDNFEHLAALGPTLARWMALAPEARLVVTSRQPLGVDGERLITLGPLAPTDARELLVTRAHQRGSAVGGDPSLDELVSRLDGLPLALELAAGRLGVLSVQDVLSRLGLSLLRSDSDGRHGTLRAALDWSWELLDDTERGALAQLSVFAGGFTLEAAEAVLDLAGASDDRPGVMALVQSLVDKSLVHPLSLGAELSARRTEPRFGLYSSLHEYAAARLREFGEPAAIEGRHGRYYAGFGSDEALEMLFIDGGGARLWALHAELDNLRVAHRRARSRGDRRVVVRTAFAAFDVLKRQGPIATAMAMLEDAVAVTEADGNPPWERGRLERLLGELKRIRGQMEESEAHYETALRLSRVAGDRLSEGFARGYLGVLAHLQGRPEEASEHYAIALSIQREAGHRRGEAYTLLNRGNLLSDQGEIEEARSHYKASLAIHRARGDRQGEAQNLATLGILHAQQGEFDEAEVYFEGALLGNREAGDRLGEGLSLTNLGILHRHQGKLELSQANYADALTIHQEAGHRRSEAIALLNIGVTCAGLGRTDEAMAHYTASLAINRSLNSNSEVSHVLVNLGSLHFNEGRYEEALSYFEETLTIQRALGGHLGLCHVLAHIGRVHFRQGRLDLARAALAEAEAIDATSQMGPKSDGGRLLAELRGWLAEEPEE